MTIEIHVHEDDDPRVVIIFPNGNRFSLNSEGRLEQWEVREELPKGGRWKHLHGRGRGGW